MGAAADAINASIVRAVLTMEATVYGRTAGTGPFNVVVRSALPCRLEPVSRQPGVTGVQRRELANMGTFRWDASYILPETGVQLEVDAYPGVRWNPIAATQWPDDAPGIGVIGRTVDVTRAL